MERLPYIDEQARTVGASPERTWDALLAVGVTLGNGSGGSLARLLGVQPARMSGDWSADAPAGATVPGFAIEEARRPSRLALAGRHRFSRYALVFELEPIGDSSTRIRALTWAAFPDPHGRVYQALVIGSGAHRLVVGRLLREIEGRACWA
jgi:hypothetical protein